MYVEKILRNQKRMERTIQLYEDNQKKKQDSVNNEQKEEGTYNEIDTISEAEAVA